ncbi:hypothetical protein MTP04_02270 [Lysinibacillus sp. PLM2]|nr:hypothetical protein MTP04_02270 [Lysinibacillus sp. PLM2]
MEKVITNRETITFGERGEKMKKVTEFFLGENPSKSDRRWLYGYAAAAIAICIFVYVQTQ